MMIQGDAPHLVRETRWACYACFFEDVTFEAQPHTRFHFCKRYGITMPMVEVGIKCKVQINEREDYIGNDDPQMIAGRPIKSITVTRDEGEDCTVYAPAASMKGG